MTLSRVLICGLLVIQPASGFALADERTQVFDCLVDLAEQLEADHGNLADLAETIVARNCFSERTDYLKSIDAANGEGLAAYQKEMEEEVRAALIAIRAKRTGFDFLSSN
ncbi:hypothetical protein [Yoonia litorea]|uniref:UrcA family protein n=1 Tax=Yoonia litorea TaxID=1123755 RepID=A0A1I6L5Y8_9RHOB|nr:hypothetical protein [Yoonia litorea]SFR98921.1 hypothetical protein SAMN05444714_0228 [Yoonia litorea]